MILRLALSFALSLIALPALAVDLTLPASARQTAGQDLGLDSYALPIAPFDGETVPARVFEGYVLRQSWRLAGGGITPLQLLQPLREELKATGYKIVFECADRTCGGFDFRFGTDVIDVPDMYVDLDNFRFVSAIKDGESGPSAAMSLLVSRSSGAAHIQIIQIAVDEGAKINVSKGQELQASGPAALPLPQAGSGALGEVAAQLEQRGHVVLSDLVFSTGSADLGDGPFASLAQVAAYLRANPERRVALVGHTDAVGGLEGNIALSKRRASSVRARLSGDLGVPEAQLSAEGVGFLSPVASNLTTPGREANRRVEAVLISTK